jgi:hypothetical protein
MLFSYQHHLVCTCPEIKFIQHQPVDGPLGFIKKNMSPSQPTTLQAITNMTDPEAVVGIELAAATQTKANEGRNDPYLVGFDEPFDVDK